MQSGSLKSGRSQAQAQATSRVIKPNKAKSQKRGKGIDHGKSEG
jgi:hypothetical protein